MPLVTHGVTMILSLLLPSALATELPLRSLSYDVDIAGPLADITLTQVFHNPSTTFIEAEYTFPLPEDAAVDGMTMTFADREVVGLIRDRAKARAAYEKAVQEGHAAALTEQQRPNVFTQSVGNLPPGEDITVTLHLVQPVEYRDGAWELAVPLVVGPRFTGIDTPDAANITPPVSRENTGLKVDIGVALETGMPLSFVGSPTHDVAILTDETGAVVNLVGAQATRDFVLRWEIDTDEPVASAIREGEHIVVTMQPPEAPPRKDIVPRELVWVVDTSCSMSGAPLDMAKRAMSEAFASMDSRDSFTVLDFNDSVSTLSPRPMAANPENIAAGKQYVDAFVGHGGTDMRAGIEAALTLPQDADRERYIVFLTDGYIGNEADILQMVDDKGKRSHVYSFGIGSSVNRYLLDEMSNIGRGVAFYSTLDEDPADNVDAFLDVIDQPVLSNINVDFGGHDVTDEYPAQVHDLVAGQPLFVVGHANASSTDDVVITGRLGDGKYERHIRVVDYGDSEDHAVASTWARQKVAELERSQLRDNTISTEQVESEILSTALEYRLLTRLTSFVAIDRKRVNRTGQLNHVDQAVDIPDGVDFDSAVSREYTPPGDPLLTVQVAKSARSVVATFPWGEEVAMRWDNLRGRWYHRFLVPRGVEDGEIQVEITVIDAMGVESHRIQKMVIDGDAPELDVDVEVGDGVTTVTVYADEPLRAIVVQPKGDPSRRVRLDIAPDSADFAHVVEIPGMWGEVELVAKDLAMNTILVRAEAQE